MRELQKSIQVTRKNAFVLISIFTVILLCLLPASNFFFLLANEDLTDLIEYLTDWVNLIVGSLSSLSGVIIAVLVVSFEIKKESLGRNAKKYFLEEKNIRFLLQIFTLTILVAVLSKSLSLSLLSGRIPNLIFINVCLFIISIFTLIPLSIRAVLSFDIYRIVNIEADKINIDNLIIHAKLPPFASGADIEQEREKYPLYILRDIALKRGTGEVYIARTISREVTAKLVYIVQNVMQERGSTEFSAIRRHDGKYSMIQSIYPYKPYIYFYKELYRQAIDIKSEYLIESYINDLYLLFLSLIKEKVSPKDTKDLFEMFGDAVVELANNDMKTSFDYALTCFETVLVTYFEKNCPKGFHVRDLHHLSEDEPPYYKENKEENFKWVVLTERYVYQLKKLLKETNIEIKAEFFSSVLRTYSAFMAKVEDINHLDIYQKRRILFFLHSDMVFETKKACSNWQNKSTLGLIRSEPLGSFINEAIEKDAFYLKDYLSLAGNYFYEISLITSLESWEIFNYSRLLNRTLSASPYSIQCDKGFVFLLNILLVVKSNLENNLEENEVCYLQICKTLNSLHRQINRNWRFFKFQNGINAAIDSIQYIPQERKKEYRFKWD